MLQWFARYDTIKFEYIVVFVYETLLSFFCIGAIILRNKTAKNCAILQQFFACFAIFIHWAGENMHYKYQDLQELLESESGNTKKELLQEKITPETGNKSEKKRKARFNKTLKVLYKQASQVELTSFVEEMDVLAKWEEKSRQKGEKNTRFFVFFEDAILGAYYRYYHSKKAAWSMISNGLFFICSAVLPVVGATMLQFATAETVSPLALTGLVLASVIVLAWLFANTYKKWHELCDHRETWVRHSVCYGRLRLALSRFVVSRQEEKDYEILVSSTFEILEQNYDQFLQNLSTHGVAKSEAINSREKGTP